jgi:hypothetical protein
MEGIVHRTPGIVRVRSCGTPGLGMAATGAIGHPTIGRLRRVLRSTSSRGPETGRCTRRRRIVRRTMDIGQDSRRRIMGTGRVIRRRTMATDRDSRRTPDSHRTISDRRRTRGHRITSSRRSIGRRITSSRQTINGHLRIKGRRTISSHHRIGRRIISSHRRIKDRRTISNRDHSLSHNSGLRRVRLLSRRRSRAHSRDHSISRSRQKTTTNSRSRGRVVSAEERVRQNFETAPVARSMWTVPKVFPRNTRVLLSVVKVQSPCEYHWGV